MILLQLLALRLTMVHAEQSWVRLRGISPLRCHMRSKNAGQSGSVKTSSQLVQIELSDDVDAGTLINIQFDA